MRHVWFVTSLAVTACQCGPLQPLTPTAFCDRLEAASCEDSQQCGLISPHIACRPGWNLRSWSRYAGCPPDLEASLDAGRVRFDGVLAADCFGVPSTACANARPAECWNVVRGLVAAGGVCTGNADCQEGLECRGGNTCPSTCALPRCDAGSVELRDGGCEQPLPPTPTQGKSLGEPCAAASECAAGFTCKRGSCLFDRAAEGEACARERLCQVGLFCVEGACSRGLAAGASCINTFVPCEVDLSCTADGQAGATCAALREGAPCTTACDLAGRLRCDLGACRPPVSEGAPCERSSQCRGACLEGRCAPVCGL
jgi:hypothetical protein